MIRRHLPRAVKVVCAVWRMVFRNREGVLPRVAGMTFLRGIGHLSHRPRYGGGLRNSPSPRLQALIKQFELDQSDK